MTYDDDWGFAFEISNVQPCEASSGSRALALVVCCAFSSISIHVGVPSPCLLAFDIKRGAAAAGFL